MTQKYCTIDEDELKELMAKVAGIQAWIRNDANIGEIQKRVNVLEYLLQKLERKLTKRTPDVACTCEPSGDFEMKWDIFCPVHGAKAQRR